MSGKVIGKELNNGFAGSYARQPDMIINTRPNAGTAAIPFGAALISSGEGVIAADSTATAANFVGIASREAKTQLSYLEQNGAGEYAAKAPVSVFQRGRINVINSDKKAALYGAVYLRTTAEGTKKAGDLESADDSGKVVKLTNCQWGGKADANGVAELVILSAANA